MAVKRSKFNESQIISVLREQEAGSPTDEVCRRHGISQQTFYRWKAKYGGMGVSDAQRLRTLDDENRRLKKLLAESMLDVAALKDILGKCMVRPVPARLSIGRTEAVCVNVSGLLRVGCCCSQAMMRSAHVVPNNWHGRGARFFAPGLRRVGRLLRHPVFSPQSRSARLQAKAGSARR